MGADQGAVEASTMSVQVVPNFFNGAFVELPADREKVVVTNPAN